MSFLFFHIVFDCLRIDCSYFTYLNYAIKTFNDTGWRICPINVIKLYIFCYNLCNVWMEIMYFSHQHLPKQQTKETPTHIHIYSTVTWHTHKFSQPLFTFTSTVVRSSGLRFIPPTWNSQQTLLWFVCLRCGPVTTLTTFEADSLSSLNTSNISDSHILHDTLSTYVLFFLLLFFSFFLNHILGKNLTKKSGEQSENISINNVPRDP